MIENWPNDADGDVFRRLIAHNFDFSKPCSIDYYVDFENWPPPDAAIELLRVMCGNLELNEPEEEDSGYVLFQVVDLVTYENVTSTQRQVSAAMQPYGGVCESWGVMH